MTLSSLPFSLPRELEIALRHAYEEPPRAYHHFGHVEEVLGHHASVPSFQDPVSTALAVLFHDAIYWPGRVDNEERSADLARCLISRHLPDLRADVARVEWLILLTARHGRLTRDGVDVDAALFLDCDMAILGAPPEHFDEYDRAIRVEFAAVPEEVYRPGRAAFLSRLLAAPRIFLSDLFHERFDARARENLTRSIGEPSRPP